MKSHGEAAEEHGRYASEHRRPGVPPARDDSVAADHPLTDEEVAALLRDPTNGPRETGICGPYRPFRGVLGERRWDDPWRGWDGLKGPLELA